MGESCRGMEIPMVCGDYRHAGMMSCRGRVNARTFAQFLYSMPDSLHMCSSECMQLATETVCLHFSERSCVYIVCAYVGVVCEHLYV